MTSSTLQNRLIAAGLGASGGIATALGVLYLLWAAGFGPLHPALMAMLGILTVAGGAFGSVHLIGQTKHG